MVSKQNEKRVQANHSFGTGQGVDVARVLQ